MLVGGRLGREAGGTFAWHRPHMAMCQIPQRCPKWGGHRAAVQLFPWIQLSAMQVTPTLVNNAKEVGHHQTKHPPTQKRLDGTHQKDVSHLLHTTRFAAGNIARTITLQFGPGQKRNSGWLCTSISITRTGAVLINKTTARTTIICGCSEEIKMRIILFII